MSLTFGVTVLPDPPYQRLIELLQIAEREGFEYGWTYDSHVLWQDSIPTLALAAQATERIKLGHMVTNPGTREPTVVASAYATLQDISDGRMVMGIGRGDSARRYIGQQPVKVGPFEDALKMIKPFMNGEQVHWNDTDIELAWVRPELPPIEMHVAGYGPRVLAVAGRVGDGVIIQLADPDIIQLDDGDGARGGRRGGPRSRGAQVHRLRAHAHLGRPGGRARAGALVPGDGLEPRARPDRPLRRRRPGGAARAHRLRAGRDALRLRRALARGRAPRGVRQRRDLRSLLRARHARAGDRRSSTELEQIGVDQFNIYLMTEGQERTLETYGREILPRFAGVTGGGT